MKPSFKNDYSEGCHPKILEALTATNLEQQEGYGYDTYSLKAIDQIKKNCNQHDADVHFISGGTQANLLMAAAFLRPHESIVSAHTGHIYTNETGAIEATGHKVNVIEAKDGKLTTSLIERVLQAHGNQPHVLKQRMVYISQATELGTLYTKKELQDLYAFCQTKQLILCMDGARLGSALAASKDLTLADIAANTDAFWIGGTKNGALLGEALVITNAELKTDFKFHLKQRGAMLSKGRVVGIQFLELFRDGLFLELAMHANNQADKIRNAFKALDTPFLVDTKTNQVFPILKNEVVKQLGKHIEFHNWKNLDDHHTAIRLVTSWATTDEQVDQLIKHLN